MTNKGFKRVLCTLMSSVHPKDTNTLQEDCDVILESCFPRCVLVSSFKLLVYLETIKIHLSPVKLSLFQASLYIISRFDRLFFSLLQIFLFCIIYWSPTVKKSTHSFPPKETLSSDVQATAFILMLQRCRRYTQLDTSLE